jgi:hypothetical protein
MKLCRALQKLPLATIIVARISLSEARVIAGCDLWGSPGEPHCHGA